MAKWPLQGLTTAVIGVHVFYFQNTAAKDNSSANYKSQNVAGNTNQTVTFLTVAWIFDPPYIIPENESLIQYNGIVRNSLLRYITVECGYEQKPPISYEVIGLQAYSEFGMIELLRTNKADLAAPIFENQDSRRYSEFPFFKIGDYPGTDFLTTEDQTNPIRVVWKAIVKSWPLLAFILINMAIAGVIMWALDTYWNSQEFPRSFIKGSWHGFWWSFISATTVGYGDKAPKSVAARVFSVIWILIGIIIIALITANITSTLTTLSLQMESSSLVNLKVAVLGNGTEYQHALQEDAQPKVYNTIDDIIRAVKTKEVDGMLLDRYRASHYQSRGKLKALITVKKLEYRKDIGVLFSKNNHRLAFCLDFFRSDIWGLVETLTATFKERKVSDLDIWGLVETLTATFKLTQQKPAENVGLFYNSSPFINYLVYPSLGILLGLLFVGTVWDILMRRKDEVQQDVVLEAINEGSAAKRQAIQKDLEAGRRLLHQMQEHFNKLEARVSELHVSLP